MTYDLPTVRPSAALIGIELTDRDGDPIGRIEKILLDPESGRIAYAIASLVRGLGRAGSLLPIPWEALTPDRGNGRLRLDLDWRRLEAAPFFNRDEWPEMSDRRWSAEVHAYYGLGPYWA